MRLDVTHPLSSVDYLQLPLNAIFFLWVPLNVPLHFVCIVTNHFCLFDLQVIDSSDVVVQVLDARDPMGTRSPHIEAYLKKEKPWKHLIFVLNKCDLVPTWATVSSAYELVLAGASRTNLSLHISAWFSTQPRKVILLGLWSLARSYENRANMNAHGGQSHLLSSDWGQPCRNFCPLHGGNCQSLAASPLCSINCIW